METYDFRRASGRDAERIWEIILQAKAQMVRENKRQWNESYPSPENIVSDIDKGYGYVLADDKGLAVAYGAVITDGESVYGDIDGEWLSDLPYVVVHRLAVADEAKHRGIATRFMLEVENFALSLGIRSFRVDTNFDNFRMHRMLQRLGFTRCGEVAYESGTRWAYEKLI